MHRTCGKVLGVVAAVSVAGVLAACGDNDSTVSSTPTMSGTTTTAVTASSSAAVSSPVESPQASAPAPQPSEAVSQTQERPAPAPAPSQDTSGMADKDRKFLDALKAQGITPSSPDIALSIGAYVCQGISAGASEADLSTFVNAMAGSDPSFDPAKMPVEQAGKIYIDTAKQTYCK
ncbi:DUF732 domain-containing protein [Nocardia arizonensis]|uniref:DUF732 domain-containing protein n=1 Tax=Nocardia arizonensis TaxID=1141647 RepID=UPI0006D15B2D|nr:DUF732 domain-containing protein [Nocardia arizonensis]